MIVEVSIAVLLAEFGSFTPFGVVTVAVSEIVPVADEGIVPFATYVMVLLAGIATVSLMLPVPEWVYPEAPPVCDAVKLTPVKLAGKVLVTGVTVTSLGPGLATTIV